jgi:hypothetical protein
VPPHRTQIDFFRRSVRMLVSHLFIVGQALAARYIHKLIKYRLLGSTQLVELEHKTTNNSAA